MTWNAKTGPTEAQFEAAYEERQEMAEYGFPEPKCPGCDKAICECVRCSSCNNTPCCFHTTPERCNQEIEAASKPARTFPKNWTRQYPAGMEYNDTLWTESGLKERHPRLKPNRIALETNGRYAIVRDSDEYKKPLQGTWIVWYDAQRKQWTENLEGASLSSVDVPYLIHCHTYTSKRLDKLRETYARGKRENWTPDLLDKILEQGLQYRRLTDDLTAELEERTTDNIASKHARKTDLDRREVGWQYRSVDAWILYQDEREREGKAEFCFDPSNDIEKQRDVSRTDSWTEERDVKDFSPAFRQLWKLTDRLKATTAQRSQEEAILHARTVLTDTLTALRSYEIPREEAYGTIEEMKRLAAWTPKEGKPTNFQDKKLQWRSTDYAVKLRLEMKELAREIIQIAHTYTDEAQGHFDFEEDELVEAISLVRNKATERIKALRLKKRKAKIAKRKRKFPAMTFARIYNRGIIMLKGRSPYPPTKPKTEPIGDKPTFPTDKTRTISTDWTIPTAEKPGNYPQTIKPVDDRKPSQERELIPLHAIKSR